MIYPIVKYGDPVLETPAQTVTEFDEELKKLADLYRQAVSYFTGDEDETAAALPADVTHLARAAAKLSVKDREELGRFAEYLRVKSLAKQGGR